MISLEVGMQIFKNGVPMELLVKTDDFSGTQVWRIKPLFVEQSERDEHFVRQDRITFIHTNLVRGASA